MPTYSNETALVKAIVAAIKEKWPDAWVFKVHGGFMQAAGVPDLIVSVHGLFMAFEVKHQKQGESEEHARGRATPLQREVIRLIQKSGAHASVVLSVEETLKNIESVVAMYYGYVYTSNTSKQQQDN